MDSQAGNPQKPPPPSTLSSSPQATSSPSSSSRRPSNANQQLTHASLPEMSTPRREHRARTRSPPGVPKKRQRLSQIRDASPEKKTSQRHSDLNQSKCLQGRNEWPLTSLCTFDDSLKQQDTQVKRSQKAQISSPQTSFADGQPKTIKINLKKQNRSFPTSKMIK